MVLDSQAVDAFILESNKIEGIDKITDSDRGAHRRLWDLQQVTISDLEEFVRAIDGGPLRRYVGMNVRVGSHFPVVGGPHIATNLEFLLRDVHKLSPYDAHVEYETLHPFMDGNGRSGRALWAWQMMKEGENPFALPFLHRFYYQALDGSRNQ